MRTEQEIREYRKQYYLANKHKWPKRTRIQRDKYNQKRREQYATCEKTKAKLKANAKKWQSANPRKRLDQRMRRYGISAEKYESMLSQQHGLCAICGLPPSGGGLSESRLHVDHCHSTNAVRGLLCTNCNHGIGKFKDNPTLLEKAAMYLRSKL